jgi:hypothetical protein
MNRLYKYYNDPFWTKMGLWFSQDGYYWDFRINTSMKYISSPVGDTLLSSVREACLRV